MKSKSSPVLLQKFPVTLIALTLIILSGVVGIAYLVSNRFGDLRPALLPAQQTFAEFIQQNTELGKPHIPVPEGTTTEQLGNSQITLPEGFGIRVVTDQLTSPRDLLVTPDNTLLVSDNERGQILAVIDSNDIVRLEIDDTQQSVVAEHDFLTGFLQGRTALGRPVDVEFDRDGHLFISDDKTGAIYEISRN